MSENCVTCRFWAPPSPGQPTPMGACRRHPPKPFMVMVDSPPVSEQERKIIQMAGAKAPQQMTQPAFLSAWPPAPAEGWCGDWVEVEKIVPPSSDL